MAGSIRNTSARRKLALIIGNDDYNSLNNKLNQSINNANNLSSLLKNIGFSITKKYNLNRNEMLTNIMEFSNNINNGDLVLFFYSGHGCHVNGENYLIPIGDDRSVSDIDVAESGIHLNRTIARLTERNTSYVTIIILDCYQSYLLTNASESNSLVESKSLQEIRPSNGVFIQYACTDNNLFITYLIENIDLENVDIRDIFQCISDNIYHDSDGKQRPLSMNGLSDKLGEVFLNKVMGQWSQIDPNDMASFITKQKELKNYYDNFPNIEYIVNRNTSNIQKAEKFTNNILSQIPSGDVNDLSTVCHILNKLLEEEHQQCLFFNSNHGINLHDAFTNLVDLSFIDRPFVLKLNSSDGLGYKKYVTGQQYDLKIIYTLNQLIEQNQSHPVIDDIIERLSEVHDTDKTNINIINFYSGSFSIVYTVDDLPSDIVRKIASRSKRLSIQFKQFKELKIHPLLYQPSFDISQFDSRGNREFLQLGKIFYIGPPGREQLYIQPIDWTRYGLKVLGKYSNDTWLHPFGGPENWYRAYHGTRNASAQDFDRPYGKINKQYACVNAIASIHKTGFRTARRAFYGAGVYCSPDPTFPEKKYVGTVELNTKYGMKAFKCMLQVAVNPDDVRYETNEIWVVKNPQNIRAYGILIKEDFQYTPTAFYED